MMFGKHSTLIVTTLLLLLTLNEQQQVNGQFDSYWLNMKTPCVFKPSLPKSVISFPSNQCFASLNGVDSFKVLTEVVGGQLYSTKYTYAASLTCAGTGTTTVLVSNSQPNCDTATDTLYEYATVPAVPSDNALYFERVRSCTEPTPITHAILNDGKCRLVEPKSNVYASFRKSDDGKSVIMSNVATTSTGCSTDTQTIAATCSLPVPSTPSWFTFACLPTNTQIIIQTPIVQGYRRYQLPADGVTITGYQFPRRRYMWVADALTFSSIADSVVGTGKWASGIVSNAKPNTPTYVVFNMAGLTVTPSPTNQSATINLIPLPVIETLVISSLDPNLQWVVVDYSSSGGFTTATSTYQVYYNGVIVSNCNNIVETTCKITASLGFGLKVGVSVTNTAEVSPQKTVTIGALSVPVVTLSPSPTGIVVSYDTFGGLLSTTYSVYLNGTAVTTCTNIAGKQCTVSGLTTLETYIVKVVAVNGQETTNNQQSVYLWDAITTPLVTATVKVTSILATFTVNGGNPALTVSTYNVNGVDYTGCINLPYSSRSCNIVTQPNTLYQIKVTSSNSGIVVVSSVTPFTTYANLQPPVLTPGVLNITTVSFSFNSAGGVPGETVYLVKLNGNTVTQGSTCLPASCTVSVAPASSNAITVAATNNLDAPPVQSIVLQSYPVPSVDPVITSVTSNSITLRLSYTGGVPTETYLYVITLIGTPAVVIPASTTSTYTTYTFTGLVPESTAVIGLYVWNSGSSSTTKSMVQKLNPTPLSTPIVGASINRANNQLTITYSTTGGYIGTTTTYAVTVAGTSVVTGDTTGTATYTLTPAQTSTQTTLSIIVTATNGALTSSETTSIVYIPDLAMPTLSPVYDATGITITYSAKGGSTAITTTYDVSVNGQLVSDNDSTGLTRFTLSSQQQTQQATYTILVVASNGAMTSQNSASIVYYPVIQTPTLTSSIVKSKSITIGYSVSGGNAALVLIYVSANGSPVANCQGVTVSSTCTIKTTPSTSYVLAVRATDGKYTSTFTSPSIVTYPVLSTPSITPVTTNMTWISFSYASSGGVPGETVTTVKLNSKVVPSSSCPSQLCTVTVVPGSSNIVTVDTINNVDSTSTSSTIVSYALPTISQFKVTTFTHTSVTIVFASVGGITSSDTVYIVTLNGGVETTYTGISTLTFTDLVPETTAIITLQVYNSGSFSAVQQIEQQLSPTPLTNPVVSATLDGVVVSIGYSSTGGSKTTTTTYAVSVNGQSIVSADTTGSIQYTLTPAQQQVQTTLNILVVANNGQLTAQASTSVTYIVPLSNPSISASATSQGIVITYSTTGGDTRLPTSYDVSINGVVAITSDTTGSYTYVFSSQQASNDATYQITVEARNGPMSTQASTSINYIPPLQETIVSATIVDSTGISIQYHADGGSVSITTTYAVTVNGQSLVTGDTTGQATYTFTSSESNTDATYQIAVVATNGQMSTQGYKSITYIPVLTSPIIQVTATGSESLTIKYTTSGGKKDTPTSYDVTVDGQSLVTDDTTEQAVYTLTAQQSESETIFAISVQATNGAMSTQSYTTFTFIPPLLTPTIDASITDNTGISIQYHANGGSESITTTYAVTVNSQSLVTNDVSGQATYTFTSTESNTDATYQISVVATNGQMSSQGSKSITYIPVLTNPIIQVTPTGSESLTIKYTTSGGKKDTPTSYAVTVDGQSLVTDDTTGQAVYTLTAEQSDSETVFAITVQATNGQMSSQSTISYTFIPPLEPLVVNATNVGSTGISIQYHSAGGSQSITTVYAVTVNGQSLVTNDASGQASYQFTKVESETWATYQIQVIATNGAMTSEGSTSVTYQYPLQPPTITVTASPNNGGLVISYSCKGGNPTIPTMYKVKLNDQLISGETLITKESITYTFTTTESSTPANYTIQVIASKGQQSSDDVSNSTIFEYIPRLSNPVITVTPDTESIMTNWTMVDGADSYIASILINSIWVDTCHVNNNNNNYLYCDFTELTPKTTYSIRVTAQKTGDDALDGQSTIETTTLDLYPSTASTIQQQQYTSALLLLVVLFTIILI
ncbi:hypothetical protein DFA_02099 [Cavenderia fasciculata]|uniref:Fibronectin type-III domain-containing protein n=1 Tax=Cavenderia fasciculata TaxID=261658 RepID=F4PYP6_CACFS|nr:uncharacterized protein DFA_02099 [Cavenderia fasciculata]EGG19312.1 hypothetical protein DFA_02099 [Cavenderia fasciculata]|eukprot:XP_004357583.1 hypothetical protein DFA_02099 [Cavenderia fasciculata]